MTPKEMLKSRLKSLNERLAERFDSKNVNGNSFFTLPDGQLFRLDGIPDFQAVVVEYASNMEDARSLRLEDGDLMNIEMSENDMFESIISEIRG